MNEDPPGMQVSADSPYKTVKDLLDAIKAAPPGKLKASGTGQGGIWHLALVGWMQALGLEPDQVAWIPSQRRGAGLQDLAAGGMDIVPCSIPEARAMIEAGKARAWRSCRTSAIAVFQDVPTLKEAMGIDFTIGAWRGFAAPKGLPAGHGHASSSPRSRRSTTCTSTKTSWPSAASAWCGGCRPSFATFMAKSDAQFGKTMKAAGLAKT